MLAGVATMLIMRERDSGRSWTSKVFNTVITLDTYQFISCLIQNLQILGALEKCSDYLVFPGCLRPD